MKKTKRLIYLGVATNPHKKISFNGYTFEYSKDLKPIAIEVAIAEADILLQMTGRVSKCCHKTPAPLFKEIV